MQWKVHIDRKCRYCQLNLSNTKYDICGDEECQQKFKFACRKILPCSHPCCGFDLEEQCLGCLNEECSKQGGDYCNICFTESLSQAPCIRSKCGHVREWV